MTTLRIKMMNEKMAQEALNWRYEKPYDFYNNETTDEAMAEMLDGTYYGIINKDNTLVGFFCTGRSAQVPAGHEFGVYEDDYVDLGLGMNPELTGKGNGYDFSSFIVDHIRKVFTDTPIRLSVATFNERAIHLYEKLGFVKKDEFSAASSDFITMVKK
ncbi:GNAT family N-acetyltransferase [Virgibacillus kekensis]|uniref:GNAT family N-acetyltransferase n=1 Tax=Virgibacillus kekensis TaxID=202261 RepID=A0ABV9DNA4_9BACI